MIIFLQKSLHSVAPTKTVMPTARKTAPTIKFIAHRAPPHTTNPIPMHCGVSQNAWHLVVVPAANPPTFVCDLGVGHFTFAFVLCVLFFFFFPTFN